uniref:Uncharacterized protein n=1 Tax=viral metagenome TaxID=1070528 RepID=A0A6M3K470_9ZZZZ
MIDEIEFSQPDWFDLSRRLRIHLMTRQHIYYGYKSYRQGGHWNIILIKNQEVYEESPHDRNRD